MEWIVQAIGIDESCPGGQEQGHGRKSFYLARHFTTAKQNIGKRWAVYHEQSAW
jgi:hypothetical protein